MGSGVAQKEIDPLRTLEFYRRDRAAFINQFFMLQETGEVPLGEKPIVMGAIPFDQVCDDWNWQLDYMQALQEHQFLMVVKARQDGITWCTLADDLAYSMLNPERDVREFSHNLEKAKEMIDRVAFMIKEMPEEAFRICGLKKPTGNDLGTTRIRFREHNSKMTCQAATRQSTRSIAGSKVTLDEFDFWAANIIWEGLRGVEGSTEVGRVTLITTSDGVGAPSDIMWNTRRGARYHKKFYGWQCRPGRTEADMEDRKEEYAAAGQVNLFYQDYPRTIEDCWQENALNFFSVKKLRERKVEVQESEHKPRRFTVEPAEPKLGGEVIPGRLVSDPNGPLWVFPITRHDSEGDPYVTYGPQKGEDCTAGADLSEGVDDDTFFEARENADGNQIMVWHGIIEPDDFTGIAYALLKWIWDKTGEQPLFAPERQGGGIAMIKPLYKVFGYKKIYRHKREATISFSKNTDLGWMTLGSGGGGTRSLALNAMRGMLHLCPETFNYEAQLEQMTTFVKVSRGVAAGSRALRERFQAKEGKHDDAVLGGMIAPYFIMETWDQAKRKENAKKAKGPKPPSKARRLKNPFTEPYRKRSAERWIGR